MEERTPLWKGMLWGGLIIGVMLLISAYGWVKIPAGQQIATHWGIDGQPNGYMGKTSALLIMPLLTLVMTALFLIIARLDPRRKHIEQSLRAYTIIWVSGLGLLAVLHGFIIANALGVRVNILTMLPPALGALFIIFGNFLGKLRSNFIAGIRTPWTLSSDLAWDKTHRFGGKVLVLVGVIIALGVFLHDGCAFLVLMLGELLLASVMLTIYSYQVWRSDPNKRDGGPVSGNGSVRPVAILTIVLILLMAAAVAVISRVTQPSADVRSRAIALVESMAAGNFTAAEQDFDSRMLAALPPERLQGLWADLVSQHGPYQRIAMAQKGGCWPFTLVHVTLLFERTAVTMRVVFSPNGQISGLWLVKVAPVAR